VIHGDRDTIAPVEEARHFASRLRQTSNAPVVYAELSGAQHAFDLFCSPRTSHMLGAVLQFLDASHTDARRRPGEVALLDDRARYLGLAVR
jgi:acetyl esterase/lipase